jgi:biotin carboxyl carrier protein
VTLQQPGRADRIHLQQGAIDAFMEDLSFEAPASARGDGGAGELRAPFNGKVIALKAAPGDAVGAGAALVVIESMKIEHVLSLPRGGRVARVQVSVGQQVGPGQMLVTLEDA